jgi:predicted dinucleotide-binding enzyme
MKIAVIGTGRIATAIGGSWRAAGHMIVFGSREPKGHLAFRRGLGRDFAFTISRR